MQRFEPYSATHGFMIGLFAVSVAVACGAGLMLAPGARRRFEVVLGGFMLAIGVWYQLWWWLPEHFDIQRSLPLHVCDVMSIVAPLGLLLGGRLFRSLTVLWGLAFCTQAFIKPLAGFGPGHVQFWGFWLSHGIVVLTALYLITVRGYRPAWRDYGLVSIIAYSYFAILFIIDWKFGLNYGYVGRGSVTGETFADRLGSWPLRVVWIALIGQTMLTAVMVVKWLPRKDRRDGDGGAKD